MEGIVDKIPELTLDASPKDGAKWIERLKEEYASLIEYIKLNKESDND